MSKSTDNRGILIPVLVSLRPIVLAQFVHDKRILDRQLPKLLVALLPIVLCDEVSVRAYRILCLPKLGLQGLQLLLMMSV